MITAHPVRHVFLKKKTDLKPISDVDTSGEWQTRRHLKRLPTSLKNLWLASSGTAHRTPGRPISS